MVAERGVHLHTLDKSIFDVPGFGPPVPQQLESGHLFRGEVSSQEVDSVSGKVRRDDRTHQVRTSTTLQHLWTRAEVYLITSAGVHVKMSL